MKKSYVLLATIILMLSACNFQSESVNGDNNTQSDTVEVLNTKIDNANEKKEEKSNITETIEIVEEKIIDENKEKTEMADSVEKYIVAIPEENRYMFESGMCEGSLPDKSEIKKIALSKINIPDGEGIYFEIFGLIDLESRKSAYGLCKEGPLMEPEIVQEYELTDEDIERYLSAFESEYLTDEVTFGTGWWKIAVEYKDGSCYSYEIKEAGLKNYTAENTMIKAFFDKMNLNDSDRIASSIFK